MDALQREGAYVWCMRRKVFQGLRPWLSRLMAQKNRPLEHSCVIIDEELNEREESTC